MSIAMMNLFTAFPELETLKLANVKMEDLEGSLEVLADYMIKNTRMRCLQMKNCVMKHQEFIEIMSTKGVWAKAKHIEAYSV